MSSKVFSDKQQAPMYHFVYQTRWLQIVEAVMVMFFILHPALPAFASETTSSDEQSSTVASETSQTTEVSEEETDSEPTSPPISTDTPKLVSSESSIDNEPDNSSDELPEATTTTEAEISEVTSGQIDAMPTSSMSAGAIAEEEAVTTGTVTTTPGEQLSAYNDATVSEQPRTTEDVPTTTVTNKVKETTAETTSTTNQVETATDASQSGAATTTEAMSEETDTTSTTTSPGGASADGNVHGDLPAPKDEKLATLTTAPAATTTDQTTSSAQSQSLGDYEFLPSECMRVADGSYYCSKATATAPIATSDIDWTVKAIPDSEGDSEIYFYDGEELLQITDNTYDDAAPHYDAKSHSIVWHALVNDRYQIFAHNLHLRETEQLTRTNTNSMEPSRYAEYTVWQQWVGSNWEIFLLYDGELSQITNNAHHDLLPDVQANYIIWNSQINKDDPQVMMYELTTGTRATITDTDGGQVVNPRFVLVYDTEFANGDSVTKGFDPKTGELITLAAQAGDTPPEIPDSDQTGETRALIQNKPPREAVEEEVADRPTTSSTSDTMSTSTSATSTVTSEAEVASSTLSMVSGDTSLPLTDFDIIVEPFSTSSSDTATTTATSS